MKTMKYPNISQSTNMSINNGSHVEEVASLFTSSSWQNSNSNPPNEYLDTHKLMLESPISNLGPDKLLLCSPLSQDENEIETKATMDALDNLLLNSQSINSNLAELKPLPPFNNYIANLNINGIQGHHYHGISQSGLPEENNNTYSNFSEQNIVSSSTCNVSVDSAGDSKTFFSGEGYADCVDPDSMSSIKYEDCSQVDSATQIKTEAGEYDISSIDDIAAIIGSAIIADTTVPNNNPDVDNPTDSRDSWMDLDAWIEGTCVDQQKIIIGPDSLAEFVIPGTSEYKAQQTLEFSGKAQQQQTGSTLQTLLTYGLPLNRIQNGPNIKQETPSSTNFGAELITTSSPPANVVSTTENLLVTPNGRFIQYSIHGIGEDHRIRSPDMLGQNYPHTTTTSTPNSSRKKRNQKKQSQPCSSTVFQTDQTLGLLGKEKPVHRCTICNRGFLNKSNIKVHLRTHTGEKPFRCDTCAKAFRQKAHLLKHQQIHKRIGRD